MIDKIYCKNFRRIEKCDIQLRDGITVLTGKNGTGKSSIVESIVFNLYGDTDGKIATVRRCGAPEDELTETCVDFTLDGKHYRCCRYLTKKLNTKATLYCYTDDEYEKLLEQDDPCKIDKKIGTEIAVSTKGVTNAITSLLGADKDGFKASFVAQQKKLDSFSGLTQENRKNFFLGLLGYECLDKIKPKLSADVRVEEGAIKMLEGQSRPVASIEQDIKKTERDLAKCRERITRGAQATEKAKLESDKAIDEYTKAAAVSVKVTTLRADIVSLTNDGKTLSAEIEKLKNDIAVDTDKSAGYNENSPLANRIAAAQAKVDKAHELENTRRTREQAEGTLLSKKKEHSGNKKTVTRLRKKTEKEPDVDSPQQELTDLKTKKSAINQRRLTADTQLKSMRELLEAVEHGDIAKCPTCGNTISSDSGREHLSEEISDLGKIVETSVDDLEKINTEIDSASSRLDAAKLAARTYNKDLTELRAATERVSAGERELEQLVQQIDEYKRHEADLAGYSMSKAEIGKLEDDIASMHEQLKIENEMKAAFYRVRANKQALSTAENRITSVRASYAEKKRFVDQNARLADSFPKKVKARDEAQEKLTKYSQALEELRRNEAIMVEHLTASNGNLEIAKKERNDLAKARQRLEVLHGAQEVISALRQTLPARIAPRLSTEASKLLDIATGGRYTILELDETYNVVIYADDGPRPLSQMSGGESDVIALCIRIAIAKMLLESKGISGQTFILDEIFGALDDERRASTCFALRNIAETMSKILCITHIEEIKDAADWMYIVETDENGVSHVREVVEENGMIGNKIKQIGKNSE